MAAATGAGCKLFNASRREYAESANAGRGCCLIVGVRSGLRLAKRDGHHRLPGCFAVGRSRADVERLIEQAIAEHISLLESQGKTVPEARTQVATVTVG